MQRRKNWLAALAAIGLCGAMMVGVGNYCRAADVPGPKPDQVKKMQEALPDKAYAKPDKARKVLVYGNAQGFVHSSIGLGMQTIKELGEKTGAWTAVLSNDPADFDAEKLNQFDAVVLVSTTGHFMMPRSDPGMKDPGKDAKPEDKQKYDAAKKAADEKVKPYKDLEVKRLQNLIEFVKAGKGLAGIHAASDAYYDQRGYGELIGGYFNGHPWNEKVGIKIDDPTSPLTQMYDAKAGIDVADEIYQFTDKGTEKDGTPKQTYSRKAQRVLTSLDYTTPGRTNPKGKSPDNDFAVSWVKKVGEGRVFYNSLGHREEIFWNPAVLKHYLAGIQFALGDLKADASPSVK